MVNVTVFKLKDLVKQATTLIVLLMLIYFIIKFLAIIKEKNNIEEYAKNQITQIQNSFNETLQSSISRKVPIMSLTQTENNDIQQGPKEDYYKKILNDEIAVMGMIETDNKSETTTESTTTTASNNEQNQNQEQQIQLASTNVETQVVTPNPISENYNVTYGDVKIKNETEYQLTDDILTPDITIDNKKIFIFHTHTCESYTSGDLYPYTPTGTFRTTDLNFTVSRVGEELTKYLQQYNYYVMHDTTYHDYPSYNGSYTKSLETVENTISQTPTDIVIDLHRDAIGSRSDYAPTVKIGDEYAAQIMFVIGTNNGGLYHPNWNQNLKFAIKLQQKAQEMYPGLFKPIMLTKSRYNQHASKYASIMEVGATGNTLEQCLTSMKYLSKVMDEICK